MADYDNTNKGVAFRNDYKTTEKHPSWKGKGNFNGQDFEIAIWERSGPKGPFFSMSFSEPYQKQEPTGYEKAKAVADSFKQDEPIDMSDIPF